MNEIPEPAVSGNPFSTRHVRPGAIPFLFPTGVSCELLLERLAVAGWRGQIIGPHGSGKSALLATLIAGIRTLGRDVELIELHDGQRRLPGALRGLSDLPAGALVVVDGYEQLAFWNRLRLRRFCGRKGLGLLVTAHGPVGLPTIFATSPDPALAQRIVQYLLGPQPWPIGLEDLQGRFTRHQGNVRDLLFELYDAYEQSRRAMSGAEPDG